MSITEERSRIGFDRDILTHDIVYTRRCNAASNNETRSGATHHSSE